METHPHPPLYKAAAAAAATKSLKSCPTLCDPIDSSPPGSPVPGILQARTLEWIAISFSNAWKWKVKVNLLSRVQLLATPWTAAYQAPPSMGFSRQEYWSGVPLPSPLYKARTLERLSQCSGAGDELHSSAQGALPQETAGPGLFHTYMWSLNSYNSHGGGIFTQEINVKN